MEGYGGQREVVSCSAAGEELGEAAEPGFGALKSADHSCLGVSPGIRGLQLGPARG